MDTLNAIQSKKNRNKSLIFASTDKNKELLAKYKKLSKEIKYLINTINDLK